jgi:UDP-N-acetyl-D-mannosaminuronic acid dehydrogenase
VPETDLRKGLLQMEPSECIVGGCGHIGLPLGIALAEVGVHVTLLDIDQARVHRVAAGRMPFLERGADELLPSVIATGRPQATTSVDVIRDHDTVVVTIETPVDEFMDPGVRSFDRSIDQVLSYYPGKKVSHPCTYLPDAPARALRHSPRWRVGFV